MANPFTSLFPKKPWDILKTITGDYSATEIEKALKVKPSTTDISKPNVAKFVDQVLSVATPFTQSQSTSFVEYAKQLTQDLARTRITNKMLMDKIPVIKQAKMILESSIMSPNDLRHGKIDVACTDKSVPAEDQRKIEKYTSDFFQDELEFSSRLTGWVGNTLVVDGARPIIIIPRVYLTKAYANKDNYVGAKANLKLSTEGMGTKGHMAAHSESLFGFHNTTPKEEILDGYTLSSESLAFNTMSQISPSAKRPREASPALRNFVSSVISSESLDLSDNIGLLANAGVTNLETGVVIKQKINARFKEAPFQTIDIEQGAPVEGEPILLECSTDAFVPIYTPGTPSDIIGGFLFLDENFVPLKAPDDLLTSNTNLNTGSGYNSQTNNDVFAGLFKSYGMTGASFSATDHSSSVVAMYRNIVESHLTDKLKSVGFSSTSIGDSDAIFKSLLHRYLQQRRTRILFVPKEFLVYFCFSHSENGTGESLLEGMKDTLILKLCIQTCRALAAFKSAIPKTLITINLDNNFRGNYRQHIQEARQDWLSKNRLNMVMDQDTFSNNILENTVSVKVTNLPGIPNYSVTSEEVPRSNNYQFDDNLAHDVDDDVVRGLLVPAAAINALGQDEFSRSIITSNIFFSNTIMDFQLPVVKHGSDFIQTYARYSNKFRKGLEKLISDTNPDRSGEEGTTSANDVEADRTNRIIDSLKITLPKPTIAPDKGLVDTANEMFQTLSQAVDQKFGDELAAGNDNLAPYMGALRGHVKAELFDRVLKMLGGTDITIPSLTDIDVNAILETIMELSSIGKSIQDITTASKSTVDATDAAPDAGVGGFGASDTDMSTGFGNDPGMGMGDEGGMGEPTGASTFDDTEETSPDATQVPPTSPETGSPGNDTDGGPTGGSIL